MTLEEQNRRLAEWLEAHGAILHHVANGFAVGADRRDLYQGNRILCESLYK